MPIIKYEPDLEISEDDSELSILDISLKHGITHMHACGGNGRCSTCRVLVTRNLENLGDPTEAEIELSKARGFEKNIRLACQSHLTGPVSIRLLVQDQSDYEEISNRKQVTTGREDNVAILFSDIRSFTGFSEKHLPYDIIHILNRYFEAMGQIVLDHGGMLDKYIGDGLMANFGLNESDPVSICLRSTAAALKMQDILKEINLYAKMHLDHEFEIGIGIHYGNVIIGELGHHSNAALTLIGDAVNQASRVESMTKKAGAGVLVSESVYCHIKDYVSKGRTFQAPLKGKTGRFYLYEITGVDQNILANYLIRQTPAEVLQSNTIAHDTIALVLKKPEGFEFKAGQFTSLQLNKTEKTRTDSNAGDKMDSRYLTIASAPVDKELTFVTRNTRSDFKKKLFSLKAGDTIYLSIAEGQLLLKPEPKRKHIFIAGGIGVTPFHSLIREIYLNDMSYESLLLVSNRNLESAIFHDEFCDLDAKYSDFRYCPSLTKSIPDDWPKKFEQGRINLEMVKRQAGILHHCIFYLAGSIGFVEDLHTSLVNEGVTSSRIKKEVFYGY